MSWDTVNIITSATVKTIAGIAQGVEDRKLDTAIHDAQHDLLQTLGETLYAMIEDADPVADPTLGDVDLRTLYDTHVVNFLAWKTKAHAYPDLWAEPDRNGVFQRNANDYTSVSGSVLNTLIAKAQSRAENRQTEMIRYLKNLDADDAIRVAYETCVKDEARITSVKHTGRISTRINPWQFPDGMPSKYRDPDGC